MAQSVLADVQYYLLHRRSPIPIFFSKKMNPYARKLLNTGGNIAKSVATDYAKSLLKRAGKQLVQKAAKRFKSSSSRTKTKPSNRRR